MLSIRQSGCATTAALAARSSKPGTRPQRLPQPPSGVRMSSSSSPSMSTVANSIFATNQQQRQEGNISTTEQPIRILYASQTGTAKMYAHMLAEQLVNSTNRNKNDVSVLGMHQFPKAKGDHSGNSTAAGPSSLLQPGRALHVFLTSVAGYGEFPAHARPFQQWLTTGIQQGSSSRRPLPLKNLEYTVFGLGNSDIFPETFNTVGRELDHRLGELGGCRVLPLELGDDGDCIDSDFEDYANKLLNLLVPANRAANEEERHQESESLVDTTTMVVPSFLHSEPIMDHSKLLAAQIADTVMGSGDEMMPCWRA